MSSSDRKKEEWLKIAGLGEDSMQKSYYPELQRELSERAAAEDKFRTFFNSINDAVLILDDATRKITEANSRMCEMFGYSMEELRELDPKRLTNFESQSDDKRIAEIITSIEEKGSYIGEWVGVKKDGERFWIEVSIRRGIINGRNCTLIVYRDMTDRKKSQQELLEKTEELESFFQNSREMLCIVDKKGRFRRVNNKWKEVLGYNPDDMAGKSFFDFIHPEDFQGTVAANEQAGTQDVSSFINRYRTSAGEYRFIEWKSYPMGELIYASAHDITDTLKSQEKLKESEDRFEALVANIPGAAFRCEVSPPWRTIYFSERIEEISGYSAEEFMRGEKTFGELMHPSDVTNTKQKVDEAIAGHKEYHIEYRIFHRDGSIRFLLEKGTGVYGSDGTAEFLDGVMIDITEKKITEEKLGNITYLQKAILDNSSYAIITSDSSGIITSFNRAAEKMLGYNADEVVGKVKPEIFHVKEEVERFTEYLNEKYHQNFTSGFSALIEEASRGERSEHEWTFVRKDGSFIPVLLNITGIYDSLGNILGYLGISSDITERKNAEHSRKEKEERQKENSLVLSQLIASGDFIAKPLKANLQSINETGTRVLNADRVGYWTFTEDYKEFFCVNLYQREGNTYAEGEVIPLGGFKESGLEKYLGRQLSEEEVQKRIKSLNMMSEYHVKNNIKSIVSFPVWVQGQLKGVLSFEQVAQFRRWEPEDFQTAQILATYTSSCIEIENRKVLQKELVDSERKYRQLFENLTSGFALHEMIYDENGEPIDYRYVEANPAFERLTGAPIAEIKGKTIKEIMPDTEEYWIKTFGNVARTGEPMLYMNYAREIGKYFETFIFSPEPGFFAVLFNDVTERVLAEDALKEERQRMNDIIEFFPDAIFAVDKNRRAIVWNRATQEMTGISGDAIVGKGNYEYALPFFGERHPILIDYLFEEHPEELKNYTTLKKVGDSLIAESNVCVLKGETRYLYGKASPLYNSKGEMTGAIELIRDITESKRAEQEIKTLNETLERKVLERTSELELSNRNLHKALFDLAETQNHLVQNEKLAALGQLAAGIAHELNTPLGAIVSAKGTMMTILQNRVASFPLFISSLNEEQRKLLIRILTQAMNKTINEVSTIDRKYKNEFNAKVTEKTGKRNDHIAALLLELGLDEEEELLDAVIRENNCEDFLLRVNDFSLLKRLSEIISIASEKAAHAVSALRSYLKQEDFSDTSEVDVQEEIDTILTLYHSKIKYNVTVDVSFAERNTVIGNKNSLNQVWINLINNALQATDYSGKLGIRTEENNGWLVVSISDNGSGIDESVRGRIFEPFFTTKKHGEGIGLGLDICKKIIDQAGGKIEFESLPGSTVFRVFLKSASKKAGGKNTNVVIQ